MNFYIQVPNDPVFQVFPSNSLCWEWLQHEFYYLNNVLRRIVSKIEVDCIGILHKELFNLFAVYSSIVFFGEGQPPKYHLIKCDSK